MSYNLTKLFNAPANITYQRPTAPKTSKTDLLKFVGARSIRGYIKANPQYTNVPTNQVYADIAQLQSATVRNKAFLANEGYSSARNITNARKVKNTILPSVIASAKLKPTTYWGYDVPGVRRLLNQNRGKAFTAVVTQGEYSRVFTYEDSSMIPNMGFSSWWDRWARDFLYINSGETIWEEMPEAVVKIIFGDDVKTVSSQRSSYYNEAGYDQYFAEGPQHCLLTPIVNWVDAKMAELVAKKDTKSSTYRTYSSLRKKLDSYLIQYKEGVPESALSALCNDLRIDIEIQMPLCSNSLIECKSMLKRHRTFKFINSRLNHVDSTTKSFNQLSNISDKPTIISQDEINAMYKRLCDANEFCFSMKKPRAGIRRLFTTDKVFEIENPMREVIRDFEQDTGLNNCKIDDINEPALSRFILDGCSYNGLVDFWDSMAKYYASPNNVPKNIIDLVRAELPPGKKLHHIDMSKAYANFHLCKYYKGFLGKITDFRATDKIEGLGMYRITNLVIPPGKLFDQNNKLHIYGDNQPYPSPELERLRDLGCTFDIVGGCWGVQDIDFRFPESMMGDNKYYAKWVGMCNSIEHQTKYWLKGNKKYFDILARNIDAERHITTFRRLSSDDDLLEGLVKVPKRTCFHLSQVTAFILSYMRMNVLDQLNEFDLSNVIRVHTDGIYHVQENVPLRNCFRVKEAQADMKLSTPPNDSGWYCSTYVVGCCDPLPAWGPARAHHRVELHIGQGGSGKTTFNLKDTGFMRPLYCAPSYKLCREKEQELGVPSTVWARVISTDPDKVNGIKRSANCLIVDEVSQMSDEFKNYILSTYKNMKIIFCGDISTNTNLVYQLPPIVGDKFTKSGIDNIWVHDTNYRCTCPQLRMLNNQLRNFIENDTPLHKINEFVTNYLKAQTLSFAQLQNQYRVQDMILAGTNAVKQIYTDAFVGKFSEEKWYIEETSTIYSHGQIVISAVKPNTKCEARHCYTVHSIQGETLPNDSKLYIDVSKMFDPRMFYTAISRARRLDQVHLVVNEQIRTFQYPHAKIYAIEAEGKTYIGSTVYGLDTRFKGHVNSAKQYYENNIGRFCTSFPLVKNGKATIRTIEVYPCDSVAELQRRESELIKLAPGCVNKTFAQ